MGISLSSQFVFCETNCHGTRLLWCSNSVTTMLSVDLILFNPQAYAIRFNASVVFLTNIISSFRVISYPCTLGLAVYRQTSSDPVPSVCRTEDRRGGNMF